MLHTTPVYFEDLMIVSKKTDTNIYTLQTIFTTLNGIATTIFFTIIIIYVVNNVITEKNEVFTFNNIGIIGGFATVYYRFQIYFGKFILSDLFQIKKNKYKIDDGGIEMPQYQGLSSCSSYSSNQTMFTDLSLRYINEIGYPRNKSINDIQMFDLWYPNYTQHTYISDNISVNSLNYRQFNNSVKTV